MIAPTKPTARQWRPNILIYGASGTGKTKTWLDLVQLTGARALVLDTHHGTDAWVAIYPDGWDVVHSGDSHELEDQIQHYCASPSGYTMFVVDDISVPHVEIQNRADDELRPLKKQRDRSVGQFGSVLDPGAKAIVRRHAAVALNKLTHLDMAKIVVARSKPKYRPKANGSFFEVDGATYSGDVDMDYSFDLVLSLERFGDRRVAVVEKARGIPDMPATIEEFTAAKLLALLPCGAAGFRDAARPEPLIDAARADSLRVLFECCAQLGPETWPAGRQSRALSAFGATAIEDVPLAKFDGLVAALRTVLRDAAKAEQAAADDAEKKSEREALTSADTLPTIGGSTEATIEAEAEAEETTNQTETEG